MSKCQWGDCTNATKVVQRMATGQEQKDGTIVNKRGVIVPMLVARTFVMTILNTRRKSHLM